MGWQENLSYGPVTTDDRLRLFSLTRVRNAGRMVYDHGTGQTTHEPYVSGSNTFRDVFAGPASYSTVTYAFQGSKLMEPYQEGSMPRGRVGWARTTPEGQRVTLLLGGYMAEIGRSSVYEEYLADPAGKAAYDAYCARTELFQAAETSSACNLAPQLSTPFTVSTTSVLMGFPQTLNLTAAADAAYVDHGVPIQAITTMTSAGYYSASVTDYPLLSDPVTGEKIIPVTFRLSDTRPTTLQAARTVTYATASFRDTIPFQWVTYGTDNASTDSWLPTASGTRQVDTTWTRFRGT